MADFNQHLGSIAPTKDQHDAVVARRGRPFTDSGMREAGLPVDDTVSSLSIVDRVIADSRANRPDSAASEVTP